MKDRDPIPNDEQRAVEWLKSQAIPIDTTTPREDYSDLFPLQEILGDARVVGLGEATHGTKEFFDGKHRLIRFLIEKMDFDAVMFEIPKGRAERVDKYIKGENFEGEVTDGLYYEIWKTEETLALIDWLKEYNKTSSQQVSFYGCDVDKGQEVTDDQRDEEMALNVLAHLVNNPNSKVALWSHNGHIRDEDSGPYKSQGATLREGLRNQYFSVGMLTGQGSLLAHEGNWQSYSQDRKVISFNSVAKNNSYEKIFSDTGLPLAFFDTRDARRDDSLRALHDSSRTMWWAGAFYDAQDTNTTETSLVDIFDGILWVAETTAATPLSNELDRVN